MDDNAGVAAGSPPGHVADLRNDEAVEWAESEGWERAEERWRQALDADPRHAEATFNLGLRRWRASRMTDDDLVRELSAVADADAGLAEALSRDQLLLGLVHRERGDPRAALSAFVAARAASPTAEVERAIAQAVDGLSGEERVLAARPEDDLVTDLALTLDERYVVTGTAQGVLRSRELRGSGEGAVNAHRSAIRAVALSPDGRTVFTGASDGGLGRWDLRGRSSGALGGHRADVVRVWVSADGQEAISGSHDGDLRIWDLRSGRCRAVLSGEDPVYSLAVTADGRHALVGYRSGRLVWWDVQRRRRRRDWAAHAGAVFAVAITPDGEVALSGGDDGALHWWDPEGGVLLHSEHPHAEVVFALTVSADGRLAVSAGMDHSAKCWEARTARCLRTTDAGFIASAVALTRDRRTLLVGGPSGVVRTVALDNPIRAPWRRSRTRTTDLVTADSIRFAALLDETSRLLDAGDTDAAAETLDRARAVPGHAREPRLREYRRRAGRGTPRTALLDARCTGELTVDAGEPPVAISADGRRVLSRTVEGALRWWDGADGDGRTSVDGHADAVTAVAFLGDGHAVSGSADTTVRVWELTGGTARRVLLGHEAGITAIAADPRQEHVLSGSEDGTLRLWDLASGACRHVLTGHGRPITSVAVTPDGRHALTGDQRCELRWWDLTHGRCAAVVPPGTLHGNCCWEHPVAVAADGRGAVVGVHGHGVKWLRLPEGRLVGDQFGQGPNFVTAVALSADGAHAVSGAADATVRIWDVSRGTCLRVLPGHAAAVHAVAMTPDAGTAVSADRDGGIRIFDLDWLHRRGR